MTYCRSLIALLLTLLLAGCAERDSSAARGRAAQRSLLQLVSQQVDYSGRWIATEGVLRHHGRPLHYWIEDDAYHRVAVDSNADIAQYVDKRVRVTGRFRYDRYGGRRIKDARVEQSTVN